MSRVRETLAFSFVGHFGRCQALPADHWITANDGCVGVCVQVVQGASSATVTLSNQKEYAASVVGTDALNDLAVLRIALADGDGALKPLQVGTSHDLMVGQKVYAIGNPFGTCCLPSPVAVSLDRSDDVTLTPGVLVRCCH